MKRTFFLLTMLLLATTGFYGTAQAQEGIKVGFRASPLIGWSTTVDDSTKIKPEGLETKAALGFGFDFVLTYGFSDNFAFKTGVTIATKGTKAETNISNSLLSINGTYSTNFTAVEVPIGFKFRSPEIGDGMYVIGHFGLNPEFNVQNKQKSEVTTTIGGVATTVNTETVDADGIRLFTASFAPGVGLDWEFDWGMLEFGVTYHWGLLSYSDPDVTGVRSRLNAIALNLGYFF